MLSKLNSWKLKPLGHNRILLLNVLFSFFVKGCAIIVGILTIPAYMAYFDQKIVLGIWYTILSILNWVINFDFGIGNGLRNKLVEAFASKDSSKIKSLITSAYISIGCIALIFTFYGFFLIENINLNHIMGIDTEFISSYHLNYAMKITWIAVTTQLVLKLVVSILNAEEKTALSSSLPLISNIMVLCFILLNLGNNDEEKLIILSWWYLLAVTLPYIVANVFVFLKKHKDYCINLKFFSSTAAKSILSLGAAFFLIQISLIVINVTNEVIITKLYGADKVVEYQVYNKIFYTIAMLFSLITNPVWSAVSVEFSKGNIKYISNIYNKLLKIVVAFSVFTGMVWLLFQNIVDLWLRDRTIIIDNGICCSFYVYTVVIMLCYAESSIANGISKLRIQLACYVLAAIIKIPLCILTYDIFHRWDAVVLINGIVLLPFVILQHIFIKKYYLKRVMLGRL